VEGDDGAAAGRVSELWRGRIRSLICVLKTATPGRRGVGDSEVWLFTEGTGGGFRYQLLIRLRRGGGGRRVVVFRDVRIGPLDLHKTFGTDVLIAAARAVQIRRVVEETNWAFRSVLVQHRLDRPPIYEPRGVVYFSRSRNAGEHWRPGGGYRQGFGARAREAEGGAGAVRRIRGVGLRARARRDRYSQAIGGAQRIAGNLLRVLFRRLGVGAWDRELVERSVQLRVGPVVVMVTQAFEERGQSALNLAVVNKVGVCAEK
jgi:hypothetical protein